MHILIAPNAFKNSLTAQQAAEAVEQGFKQSRLECSCETFPIGDGGDGTAFLITSRFSGTPVETVVSDPLGRKISASFGLIDNGHTAVIEMADASGLRLLRQDELDPLRASSFGTGEMIRAALDKGVKKIIIGLGGSATVDGGSGILSALGVRFLNASGEPLPGTPERLTDLSSIDLTGLDQRIDTCEVIVLCDVDNRLLGEEGCVRIFGPQKGASAKSMELLETALSKLSSVTLQQTGINMENIKYGGAAGGIAAGLHALMGARLVNGIDHFLTITGFDEMLDRADLVVTGEGSIDEQTLQGKGPFGVASRAKSKQLPVIGIAGKIPLQNNEQLAAYFDVLMAIGNEPAALDEAMRNTFNNLVRTSAAIGNVLALTGK